MNVILQDNPFKELTSVKGWEWNISKEELRPLSLSPLKFYSIVNIYTIIFKLPKLLKFSNGELWWIIRCIFQKTFHNWIFTGTKQYLEGEYKIYVINEIQCYYNITVSVLMFRKIQMNLISSCNQKVYIVIVYKHCKCYVKL